MSRRIEGKQVSTVERKTDGLRVYSSLKVPSSEIERAKSGLN